MSDSERGMIFNIQGYSIHDGPGIRTTVFLKGMPAALPMVSEPGVSSLFARDLLCSGEVRSMRELRPGLSGASHPAARQRVPNRSSALQRQRSMCGALSK